MPASLTPQIQAEASRCFRCVASIIEGIDLGYAKNAMRVLICLTAPTLMKQGSAPTARNEISLTDHTPIPLKKLITLKRTLQYPFRQLTCHRYKKLSDTPE